MTFLLDNIPLMDAPRWRDDIFLWFYLLLLEICPFTHTKFPLHSLHYPPTNQCRVYSLSLYCRGALKGFKGRPCSCRGWYVIHCRLVESWLLWEWKPYLLQNSVGRAILLPLIFLFHYFGQWHTKWGGGAPSTILSSTTLLIISPVLHTHCCQQIQWPFRDWINIVPCIAY